MAVSRFFLVSSLALLCLGLVSLIFVNDKVFLRQRVRVYETADTTADIISAPTIATSSSGSKKIVVGLDLIDSGAATSISSPPLDLSTSVARHNSVSKETQLLVHKTLSKIDSWFQLPRYLRLTRGMPRWKAMSGTKTRKLRHDNGRTWDSGTPWKGGCLLARTAILLALLV